MFPESLTAKEIMKALRHKHAGGVYEPWAFFEEFYPGTGTSAGAACRIDAWAMNTWPSERFTCVAYEVKVSRGDFLRELQQPMKRSYALRYSNEYYFVTPADLVHQSEIPPEAGLIEVRRDKQGYLAIRTKLKAPFRQHQELTWSFLAAVARRAARHEGQVAGEL